MCHHHRPVLLPHDRKKKKPRLKEPRYRRIAKSLVGMHLSMWDSTTKETSSSTRPWLSLSYFVKLVTLYPDGDRLAWTSGSLSPKTRALEAKKRRSCHQPQNSEEKPKRLHVQTVRIFISKFTTDTCEVWRLKKVSKQEKSPCSFSSFQASSGNIFSPGSSGEQSSTLSSPSAQDRSQIV